MSAPARPTLKFGSADDAIDHVRRCRGGYARLGRWSLSQICWHLDVSMTSRMTPADAIVPNTPEQDANRAMFATVMSTGVLPAGLDAPATFVPPPDADETAIARCMATLERFKSYPGPFATHRRFGNMSDDDARRHMLIHAAHHLSHLMPIDPPTPRNDLKYRTVIDVIADVEHLRKGHVRAGQWTLAQAAWHVDLALHLCLRPVAPDARSTPEQQAMKANFLDGLFTAGVMPAGIPIAPGTDPVAYNGRSIDDGDIDRFIADLHKLEGFAQERVNFGPFGIVSNAEFRQFILLHAANHLRNFIPTT